MIKGAWILPAFLLAVLALAALFPARLLAAGPEEFRRAAPSHFKDLPGVVPQEDLVKRDALDCVSAIEKVYRPRHGYRILYGDSAPRRVYRCTTPGGTSFTGTQLPNPNWVPGLNPHHLPKGHY